MSSTYDYLSMAKNIKPLTSSKMFASGVILTLEHLGEDGKRIGSIEFPGEQMNELVQVIDKATRIILSRREVAVQIELSDIRAFLGSESKENSSLPFTRTS